MESGGKNQEMAESLTAESAEIEVVCRGGGHVLSLCGSLGMPEVHGVYRGAMRLAAELGTIWLDVSRLERADASILQVLVALHRECARQGRMLETTGLTARLRQQWEAAGWGDLVSGAQRNGHAE
jgi:ABC-type transporter Mla MlaB component